MADINSILGAAQADQKAKADAWEVANGAKDQNDFTTRLGSINIPQEVKAQLWEAKYGGSASSTKPASEAFTRPQGSAASRAAGGFIENTVGGLVKGGKMALDLARTHLSGQVLPSQETQEGLASMVEAPIEQGRQAGEAYKKGRYSEAIGHGLAAIPLIGPPAAAVADRIAGSGERPELDKYGNVVRQERAPDVAGGVGAGVGLVVASSPKNIVAPAIRGTAALASKIPIPERLTPEGMYQSALRPSLSKKNLPKIQKQVATGLKERIPVSPKGLEKTRATIDDINQEISDRLQSKSDELGPVVSPQAIASGVEEVRPTFAEQVNPEADLAALDKSKQEFLRRHSTQAPYTKIRPGTEEAEGTFVPEGAGSTTVEKPMTLSETQAEKVGTYRQLRKKYGELGSADVEAQKSMARKAKDEIVKRVPELSELNARDGALIELEEQIGKTIGREGNKNILGLVPATMSHNPFGFLATLLMDNPAIKSRIAIALGRARAMKGLPPTLTAPAMSGAAIAGNAARPPALSPPQNR